MNKLYVGIDVGSRGNATYLMTPDGSKHCAFTVENNTGGARLLTDKVISAMESLGLDAVNIGMEATGVYGNHLVHFCGKMVAWADTSEKSMCSTPSKSRNSRNPILIYRRTTRLTHLWLPTVSVSEESNRRSTWMTIATKP